MDQDGRQFEVKSQPQAANETRQFWRQLLNYWKWVLTREELPRAEILVAAQPTERSPLGWLASRDSLPDRTDSSPNQRVFSSWLASREILPNRSETQQPRVGFLAWLTAGESLPSTASDRTQTPRSFFRWLVFSEPHDRFENPHSTKEVPPHES
jgi:hypothetical protein